MSLSMFASVPPDTFTPEDREVAREASRAVSRLNGRGVVRVQAEAGDDTPQTFLLPAVAVQMLTELLVYLAEGRGVSILPSNTALTTQQAADMLNVSRPYLIRLVEEGRLAHHTVGTHRRVLLQDLLAYRTKRNARSEEARAKLISEAQELDMGY